MTELPNRAMTSRQQQQQHILSYYTLCAIHSLHKRPPPHKHFLKVKSHSCNNNQQRVQSCVRLPTYEEFFFLVKNKTECKKKINSSTGGISLFLSRGGMAEAEPDNFKGEPRKRDTRGSSMCEFYKIPDGQYTV